RVAAPARARRLAGPRMPPGAARRIASLRSLHANPGAPTARLPNLARNPRSLARKAKSLACNPWPLARKAESLAREPLLPRPQAPEPCAQAAEPCARSSHALRARGRALCARQKAPRAGSGGLRLAAAEPGLGPPGIDPALPGHPPGTEFCQICCKPRTSQRHARGLQGQAARSPVRPALTVMPLTN